MRSLILFRHAKAEAAEHFARDMERPLAPRGLQDGPDVARQLTESGLGIDLALVSPAQRTQETWFVIAPFFEGSSMKTVPALYDADANGIWKLLHEHGGDSARLAVVGHNPFLQDLAIQILKQCKDQRAKDVKKALNHLPTSGAVAFEFPDGPLKMNQAACLGFWQP